MEVVFISKFLSTPSCENILVRSALPANFIVVFYDRPLSFTQMSSGLSPGKSAIPKKTPGVKNSVVGVQRRATFGYGDSVTGSRGPSIERANKTTTPTTATPTSSGNTDIRR